MSTLFQDGEKLARLCQELRDSALFGEGDTKLTPISEQHWLMAVGLLEQAQRAFKLSDYHQMKGE